MDRLVGVVAICAAADALDGDDDGANLFEGDATTVATISASSTATNPRDGDAADTREGDAADTREGDAADTREGDAADTREGDAADTREGDAADTREGDAADTREGDAADLREGDATTVAKTSGAWREARRREGDAADLCNESSSESPSMGSDPLTSGEAEGLPGDKVSLSRAPSEEDVLCRSERDAVISRLRRSDRDAAAGTCPCPVMGEGDLIAASPTLDPCDILA
jgi:hypothetical protein